MYCPKIVVVCMLILLLEATPWSPRHKVSSKITTRRLVKAYNKGKMGGYPNTVIVASPAEFLPATITPVDENTTRKEPILHKIHREMESDDLLVKHLEIEGVDMSGINDWFILDDHYNLFEVDEEYYEYYNEYFEEFWEETLYEYDEDNWEDWDDLLFDTFIPPF